MTEKKKEKKDWSWSILVVGFYILYFPRSFAYIRTLTGGAFHTFSKLKSHADFSEAVHSGLSIGFALPPTTIRESEKG